MRTPDPESKGIMLIPWFLENASALGTLPCTNRLCALSLRMCFGVLFPAKWNSTLGSKSFTLGQTSFKNHSIASRLGNQSSAPRKKHF